MIGKKEAIKGHDDQLKQLQELSRGWHYNPAKARPGSARIDYSATYMPSGTVNLKKHKADTDIWGYSHDNWRETVWNMRHMLGLLHAFRDLMKNGYPDGSGMRLTRKLTRKQAVALARVAHEVDHAFYLEEIHKDRQHKLGCKVATTGMIIMAVKAHRKMLRMMRIFTGFMVLPPIKPANDQELTTFVYRKKMGNYYWVRSLFADCPEDHQGDGNPAQGWDFTDVSDEDLLRESGIGK